MAHLCFAARQITCKLVYCGPALAGKTTNLEAIHARVPAERRGKLCSIATQGDRTLFFDYLPLEFAAEGGVRVRFQVYTVPGQVYYAATRALVLQGVDGVVFVADAQPERLEENVAALRDLDALLRAAGREPADVPRVFQWNKQDLPGALEPAALAAALGAGGAPAFVASAVRGDGVLATLKALCRLVLARCRGELTGELARARGPDGPPTTPSPEEAAAAVATRGVGAPPPDEGSRAATAPLPEPAPGASPAEGAGASRAHGGDGPRGYPWSSRGAAAGSSDDPLVGRRLGGCVVRALLGEGGMGAVYAARHEALGKDVVVKVLAREHAASPRRVERFLLEGRALARLDHPNVVRAQDLGVTEDGLHFLVMELVEGFDLAEAIARRGQHPVDEALAVVTGVARGLAAMHAAGLVHRDVKPENVVVDGHGGVKLIDLGLVKDERADLGLTRQGALVGTPLYLAPEAARGERVDARADLWSLGLTWWALLAGRQPFEGVPVQDVLLGRARIAPPERLRRDVPPPMRRLLASLLARRPEDRPADAGALLRDLAALAAGREPEATGRGGPWPVAPAAPAAGEARVAAGPGPRQAAAGARARPGDREVGEPAVSDSCDDGAASTGAPAPGPIARAAAPAPGVSTRAAGARGLEGLRRNRDELRARAEVARRDPTRRLGRYVALEDGARDDVGVLCRAWDPEDEVPVLLRVVEGVRRLERAALLALDGAARHRHPHLLGLLAHVHEDGLLLAVHDDLGGRTLAEHLERGDLGRDDGLRVLRDVARGLAHLHAAGEAHGALTAASVLVAADGGGLVLDVGLARVARASPSRRLRLVGRLTRAGAAPPELRSGEEPATPAGDVWAFGALAARVLDPRREGGQGGGDTTVEVRALGGCQAPDPRDRPTAAELAQALDRALVGAPLLAMPAGRGPGDRRGARADPRSIAVAAALALAVGLAVGVGLAPTARAEPARVRAEGPAADAEGATARRTGP